MALEQNKSISSSHWFFSEIVKAKGQILQSVFLNIIIFCFQIITSLFVMVVYNKILPNSSLTSLKTLLIGISVILLFDFIFKILKSRIIETANINIEQRLQRRLFRKVLSWDLQSKPKLSGASSTLLRDLESITELFTNNSITTLVGIPFVFINCFIIYLIAGPLALVTISIASIAFFISLYFYFLVRDISSSAKQASIDKNSVYLESLNNLETLKSIADYEFFFERFLKTDNEQRKISTKLKNILSDANTFNTLLSSIAQISIVSVGAYLVIKGIINPGALIGSVILNGKTLQPIMQLANLLQKYSLAKTSYVKLDHTFKFNSEEEKRRLNLVVEKLSGEIRFENVVFQPDGLPSPLLTIKNLRIKEGEKIGIVGSVGSGKSTFVKLLSGVFTPTQGTICYGPFDTSAINQSDFRKNVSYLGQTPGIFSGTIRENLSIGNDQISDEQIIEAMTITGFEKILKRFPNGLSFVLSENGAELSGGQKQILALTRSILSYSRYYVLDEPTSAMDPRHEHIFIRQVADFLKTRTFIVVTHRKPILALTNRIIVIENGSITMDGKRDEIINKFS